MSTGRVRGAMRTGRVGSTMRNMTATMYRSMMYSGRVDMHVSNVGMAVSVSHQAGGEKKAKAQHKTENENQGKRISSDQSLPSFRGSTCLILPSLPFTSLVLYQPENERGWTLPCPC